MPSSKKNEDQIKNRAHILNKAEQSHSDAGSKYKCPYDDLDTVWTGRTKTILSKIFYIMRCPHGHETDSESPN